MKSTKRQGNSLFLIIGIVFICISMGLCVLLLMKDNEYADQVGTIEDVKDMVVIAPTEAPDDDVEEPTIVDDDGEHVELTYVDANLLRRVNFDALMEINTDATRWLYIPESPIDSYVMQEQTVGDYYYLWKDIYKKYSSSGSLLTPQVPLGMDDAHLIIFGHRIFGYDEVGFGSLRLMFADAEAAAAYPYLYVYYPDRAERWKIWSACDVKEYDRIYEYPYEFGSEKYAEMLTHVGETARFQNYDKPDAWTQTLFLSTCNGSRGGSEVRFLVACLPDMVYYYETATLTEFGVVDGQVGE